MKNEDVIELFDQLKTSSLVVIESLMLKYAYRFQNRL